MKKRSMDFLNFKNLNILYYGIKIKSNDINQYNNFYLFFEFI